MDTRSHTATGRWIFLFLSSLILTAGIWAVMKPPSTVMTQAKEVKEARDGPSFAAPSDDRHFSPARMKEAEDGRSPAAVSQNSIETN